MKQKVDCCEYSLLIVFLKDLYEGIQYKGIGISIEEAGKDQSKLFRKLNNKIQKGKKRQNTR